MHGFSLRITRADVVACGHPGECDADVECAVKKPYLARQFAALDPAKVKAELREYGAWDEKGLANAQENALRLLWCACCELSEDIHAAK